MSGLTADQKRTVAALAEPLLGPLHQAYRIASGRPREASRIDLADPHAAQEIQNVLVVRLDAIGDLLLSEPALGVLRCRYPQARIDLVANPASAAVLQGNPNIDRLVSYSAPWHAVWRGNRVDWRREAARFWGVTSALRQQRYDVGFELRGDVRDILFLAAAAPKTLVGSGVRGGGGVLDYDIHQAPDAHQVELAVTIASAGSATSPARPPKLYLSDAERARARALLPDEKGSGNIALHLGAGFPSKCLPMEKFAAVVRALQQHHSPRRFVVIGGPEERPLVEQLNGCLMTGGDSRTPAIVDLVGQVSLLESAAVLERCDLFLGNDSAPMHLAVAMGTPVVTFFGPSEPWRFHPFGVPYRLLEVDLECRPCDYVHCRWSGDLRYQCMTHQSVEAIVAAAEELLAEKLLQPL